MLFDTHCHLTDEWFRPDLDEVLERARAVGVERLVCITSNPDDTLDALARVADGRRIWTTVGVHPHEAQKATPELLGRVRELAGDARVVAVGECGLDFHYDNSPRDVQLHVFQEHVAIARISGLPLVVHCRDAHSEMTRSIQELPPGVTGVLHCFTGGHELLAAALAAGWSISVTGMVTFRRFDGAVWLKRIPEDRLMIETDAPYLAPVPHRGRRNEPAFVALVAEAVARIRGEPLERVLDYTSRNAHRFFGVGLK